MKARYSLILAAVPFLAGWGDRHVHWPHAGPMPDDPAIHGRSRYQSIMAGTKSYRPVVPLPWGEINRRVAPPGTLPPDGKQEPMPQNEKSEPPKQQTPQHKH